MNLTQDYYIILHFFSIILRKGYNHFYFYKLSEDSEDNFVEEPKTGELREHTLRELATLDITHQPLCIIYLETTGTFELKTGLIHLLLAFHGRLGEDL